MRLLGWSSDHTKIWVSMDPETTRRDDGDHATLVTRAWWNTQSDRCTCEQQELKQHRPLTVSSL